MAISALGLYGIEAGVGAAADFGGAAISTRKTKEDKENIKQLEELRRRQEMGTLGLTEDERMLLETEYGTKLAGIARAGEQDRRRLMASQDVYGGQALLGAAQEDAAIAQAAQAATADIRRADIEERAREEKELAKRADQERQRQQKRQEAFGKALESTADRTMEGAFDLIETRGQKDKFAQKRLGAATGLSDKEAQEFARFLSQNPDIAGLLMGSF